MALTLRYAARTDVGLLREGNEDSGYAGPRLLALADGMGGQAYGEVASSTVIAALAHLDEDVPGADLLDTLAAAVEDANEQLRAMIDADSQLDTMGTTLTVLYFSNGRVGVVHIGDSRAYMLRDGELSQITRDHTFVQTLVDEGRITAEQATHHPHRSLIMRALDGRGDRVELDLSVREARPGDRYLVCSDGLTDVVSHETIARTLAEAPGPGEAADELVGLALRAGGPDNVTCLVADVAAGNGQPGLTAPQVVGAAADRATIPRAIPDTPAGRAAALAEPGEGVDGDDETDPSRQGGDGSASMAAMRRRRGYWLRRTALAGFVLVVIGAISWGGYAWSQRQYYVGASEGRVAIYRGLSQPVVGIHLSKVYERPNVALTDLPNFDRSEVEQTIEAKDLDHARKIVQDLQSAAAECQAARAAAPVTPTSSPSPRDTTPGASGTPSSSAGPTTASAAGGTPSGAATQTPSPSQVAGTASSAGATPTASSTVSPSGAATSTPTQVPSPSSGASDECDGPTE